MMSEQFFYDNDEEEEFPIGYPGRLASGHRELIRKDRTVIARFLGNGERACESWHIPPYYGGLQTWALKHYIEEQGWKVIRTFGYHESKPIYEDVETDYDRKENLLADGQLLIRKQTTRLLLTVRAYHSILVESTAKNNNEIGNFLEGVKVIFRERNFYRGKKIQFSGYLRFLNLKGRSWDGVILRSDIKGMIKEHTIDFFSNLELWERFKIPLKRGILLVGEPGVGKTLICEALMAIAKGITCISMRATALPSSDHICELYDLAQDLTPSLVFIEDIDLVGKNRGEFDVYRPILNVLLEVLDGLEKKRGIVTVATTNCVDTLDKAISERPGRFDHVINIPRPSVEQRRELVAKICLSIPLCETDQYYIACKADNFTPAQVQEIIFSLCIQNPAKLSMSPFPEFGKEAIDRAIAMINGRSKRLGFDILRNHNGRMMVPSNMDSE